MYLTKKCNYYKLIIKIKIGGSKMALIGKKLENFTVQAYQNEEFKELNFEKDMSGKWNIFVFYPADFTFVCPTELEDLEAQHE